MRNTKITVLCVLFVVVQFLSQENGGVLVGVEAFTVAPPSLTTTLMTATTTATPMSTTTSGTAGGRSSTIILAMGGVDPSKSGTKKERMQQLAEMEKLGNPTTEDKSIFIKAAGGFVALIVIAIAAAASQGLLTQY